MKFSEIINGYLAQRAWDASTLSRLAFWQDQIGPDTEFESITETDVDDAIVALKTRGRLLVTVCRPSARVSPSRRLPSIDTSSRASNSLPSPGASG